MAPPEKLDGRGGKRGRGFGRGWGRMDNLRLTREGTEQEGEVLSDSEAGAQASGGDQPEGCDLATLHQLLVKTLQTQEREALKQEQRWNGVQIQLNQLRDDVEADRGRQPPPPPGLQLGGFHFPLGGAPAAPAPAAPVPAAPAGAAPPVAPDPAVAAPAAMAPAPAAPVTWSRAAIPRFEEGDDIEQYLTTFERLAMAYRWPRHEWAVLLVPYLSGRARSAYVAMDPTEAMDYDRVKEAILKKFEINEEVYRRRFRETRYAAVELECLAVKWALDTFKYYLLGRDFSVETDHRALQWLGRMKDSNARVTRWFLALQPYRFTVQYRAGTQNTVADFLSRHPVGETPEGEGNVRR